MIDLDKKTITCYQIWGPCYHNASEYVSDIQILMTEDFQLIWNVKTTCARDEVLSFTDKEFANQVLEKCNNNFMLFKKTYNVITHREDITTFYVVKNFSNKYLVDLDIAISLNSKIKFQPITDFILNDKVVPLAFESKRIAEKMRKKLGKDFIVEQINFKLFKKNRTPFIRRKK